MKNAKNNNVSVRRSRTRITDTTMRRIDAIRIIIQNLEDEIVIHANGMICRESFFVKDRPQKISR